MSVKDFKAAYKTINKDNFPEKMELSFYQGKEKQSMIYEKVQWNIAGEERGLRYGENPCQEAALYKLLNGNLVLGEVEMLAAGKYLASDIELLQSGKHPGKTNITDADNALNIMRYLMDTPACVIVKHNNPSGVAIADDLPTAYTKALMADRVAAFGGAVAVNRPLDKISAQLMVDYYCEVVIAPDFEEGVLEILATKKNLRVFKIGAIDKLRDFMGKRVIDFKALMDGGLILQWSYVPKAQTKEALLPAQSLYKGKEYKIDRMPTEAEYKDLLFGWLVESGITSNSVIYVKDGVTVGIGTGEQDRVGVAEIARDKAYKKLADRYAWEMYKTPWNLMEDENKKKEILEKVNACNGGLKGSCMISDAFFPFRDGIDVGLNEGVTSVIQPGGSIRDFEAIEACNEKKAAMVFTGQRSFKH